MDKKESSDWRDTIPFAHLYTMQRYIILICILAYIGLANDTNSTSTGFGLSSVCPSSDCKDKKLDDWLISTAIVSSTLLLVSTECLRDKSQLKFIEDNRENIMKDISQGGGEYLDTLLISQLNIKLNPPLLQRIQSNFEILSKLNNKEFLDKLKEMVHYKTIYFMLTR